MHHNALCLLWNVSIVINRREKKEYVFGSSWWMCNQITFTVSSHIDFFRHFDRGINDWLCKWANNQFHLCIITCIIFYIYCYNNHTQEKNIQLYLFLLFFDKDMSMTISEKSMMPSSRSFLQPFAPLLSQLCGSDPVSWFTSGLSLTALAWTLNCGWINYFLCHRSPPLR